MQIGSWGFRKRAYDKLIYNQYASPQELGLSLCQYIVHNDISYMNEVFDNLIEVTEEYPTINQLKLVNKITGLNFPQFYSWKRIIFDTVYNLDNAGKFSQELFTFILDLNIYFKTKKFSLTKIPEPLYNSIIELNETEQDIIK